MTQEMILSYFPAVSRATQQKIRNPETVSWVHTCLGERIIDAVEIALAEAIRPFGGERVFGWWFVDPHLCKI